MIPKNGNWFSEQITLRDRGVIQPGAVPIQDVILLPLSEHQFRHLGLIRFCPRLVTGPATGVGTETIEAGVFGREPQGSVEINQGARRVALVDVGNAAIGQRVHVEGIERKGAVEVGQCRVRLPEPTQDGGTGDKEFRL